MIELVIFDCDGVLVDTEQLIADAIAGALQEAGKRVASPDILRVIRGHDDARRKALLEEHLGYAISDHVEQSARVALRDAFMRGLEPIAGARSVLSGIGTQVCVATNATRSHCETVLKASGLGSFFKDRMFSAHDIEKWKPAPDLFLHAASTLGADPINCVVVEDSAIGIEAALAARMQAVLFDPNAATRTRSESVNVQVVSELEALPAILRGLG
jgi:HAD superfamily hydrolase (TIGR01509 family)